MPTWTFIRHGQSTANAQGWFAGQRDAPLTALGQEQAAAAAANVAAIPFDRALCSDLSRAHATARRVLAERDVPLTVTPALRERTCGTWEGRALSELESDGRMPSFAGWTTRPGDGESLRDVAVRVCALFSSMADVPSTLVVSHGALMRAVIGLVDATPFEAIGRWRPGNCEVIQREVSASGWTTLFERLRER